MKNISCIELMSIGELSKLTESDLFHLSVKINKILSWTRSLSEKLEDAIQIKYEKTAKKELSNVNKNFGTIMLTKLGFNVKVEIPQKITWDQKELKKIYRQRPEIQQKELFKITYSIDEKVS